MTQSGTSVREISVYDPGISFPSVSVTGTRCAMSCAHCSGRYLTGMVDVSEPGFLFEFGKDLWKRGGKGMLVSGGCDPFGAVDLPSHTFDDIRRLKKETQLEINLHCGLIDDETADKISRSGVDKVSFDLVYDDGTIKNVLGLDASKEDFIDTIMRLKDRGVVVVPHILAGLNNGKISWEHDAVERISKIGSDETVLIILIPTKGTDFEDIEAPDDHSVMELARKMRKELTGRLVLGCMRPKGSKDLEMELLKIGFDGMVLPSRATLKWIEQKGWKVRRIDKCCCMG